MNVISDYKAGDSKNSGKHSINRKKDNFNLETHDRINYRIFVKYLMAVDR